MLFDPDDDCGTTVNVNMRMQRNKGQQKSTCILLELALENPLGQHFATTSEEVKTTTTKKEVKRFQNHFHHQLNTQTNTN